MLSPKVLSNLPASGAFEAMWCGDYHRALALLHNVDVPGAALLRARAWSRLGRRERVIAEYAQREPAHYDVHERVQLLEVAAQALNNDGMQADADDLVSKIEGVARRSGDPLLVAYAAQAECRLALACGDLERSARAMANAFHASASLNYAVPRKPHHIDAVVLRSRLYDLDAWHRAFRGEYAEQEESLLKATFLASDPRNPDRAAEAQMLGNLAMFVQTMPAPRAQRYLHTRAASFPWTAHTDELQTRIRAALENARCLFGYRLDVLNLGGRTAPSLALRLTSCVTTLLFGKWDDPERFLDECRFCISVALELMSAGTAGFEIFGIMELAAVIAPFDLGLAVRARDVFRARRAYVPKTIVYVRGSHTQAMLAFVDGCIAKAEGFADDAVKHFAAAMAMVRIDRGNALAAVAGIERYALSSCEGDLEEARAFVREFPGTAFSQRLAAALASAESATPSEWAYLGMYGLAAAGLSSGRGSAAAALTPHIRADRTA